MSVHASIDICLRQKDNSTIPIGEIVTALVDYGWAVERECGICYSILDADDVHLNCEPVPINILTEKLEIIRATSELISIELTWQNTEIGGPLHFYGNCSDTTCSLGLEASRQRLPPDNWYGMTDFQWYLPKLLPPLHKRFGIEQFSCHHIH